MGYLQIKFKSLAQISIKDSMCPSTSTHHQVLSSRVIVRTHYRSYDMHVRETSNILTRRLWSAIFQNVLKFSSSLTITQMRQIKAVFYSNDGLNFSIQDFKI